MSYLNVTNVSHSFGGRQILENVSFKLLRGEHVGLVGANGEGKSTFLNIVTGHVLPDEGKVEWPGKVTVGYLDQQSTLEKGMTIREVLRTAFDGMYAMEQQMLELYDKMGDASPEELDKMMNTVGEIQSELEHSGFYSLDSKIEEFANGLGLGSIGLDKDVSELSGGQRSKVLLTKLLLQNSQILLLDEPTNYLDAEHIEWLTKFLQNYEHAFILISHDIPFLNKVVNVIIINDKKSCQSKTKGDWKLPLLNRLKEYRSKLGINQTELGKRAGVSRQTISLIERGDYSPSVTLALKIAKICQVTVEDIFEYKEDENDEE